MDKSIIAFKGRTIDFNKPVKIHKNRHNGLWAIRQKNIVGYTKDLWLTDISYHVNEYGRKLYEKEGKRTTFTYIKGKIIPKPYEITCVGRITYKPGDYVFLNGRKAKVSSDYLHFGEEIEEFIKLVF